MTYTGCDKHPERPAIARSGPKALCAECASEAHALGLSDLVRAWSELGPNARRLLEYTAQRLVIGKAHGDFDKPRNWDKEIAEEEFDGAMYRAAKALGYGAAAPEGTAYVPACASADAGDPVYRPGPRGWRFGDGHAKRICPGCGSELTPGANHTHSLP